MADPTTAENDFTIREDGEPVVICARLNGLCVPLGTARTVDGMQALLLAAGIGATDKYSVQCRRGVGANGEFPDGGSFKLKMGEPFNPNFFAIVRCFLRGDPTGTSAGFLVVSSDGEGVFRVPEDLPPAVFDDAEAAHVVWDAAATNARPFARDVFVVAKGKGAAEFERVGSTAELWEYATREVGTKTGAKINVDVTRGLTDAENAQLAKRKDDLDNPGVGGSDHFYRVGFVLRHELLTYLQEAGPPVYVVLRRKGGRTGGRTGSPDGEDLFRMLAGALGRS